MADIKSFDFSLFSDAHLLDLSRQVDREIARRRNEVRKLVRSRGVLAEGNPPKYRNPFNPAQTWSGKGSRPSWVVSALAVGMTLEDLARDDNHPTRKASGRR